MSQSRKTRRARAAAARKRREVSTHRDAQGRVHLALHEDPVSGAVAVALTRPVFKETWQNDVAAAAANTAYALLRDAPTVGRAVELARNVMASMSRLSEGLLAQAPAGSVACKAGCDHCCYQSVGVTAPEALAIFDYLERSLSEPEFAEVAAHLSEAHERTRGLSPAERFSPEHPCPFLRDGCCSIYEVRPLSCRGMNSLDADECAQRLRDPEGRAAFLRDGFGGHSFMEPIRGFHAISAGIQLGLSELFKLDMRPLDLTAVMTLLLNGVDSLADEWVRGKRPFESARGGDSTGERGIREMSGTLASTMGEKG